jgi:hypothetical protein
MNGSFVCRISHVYVSGGRYEDVDNVLVFKVTGDVEGGPAVDVLGIYLGPVLQEDTDKGGSAQFHSPKVEKKERNERKAGESKTESCSLVQERMLVVAHGDGKQSGTVVQELAKPVQVWTGP